MIMHQRGGHCSANQLVMALIKQQFLQSEMSQTWWFVSVAVIQLEVLHFAFVWESLGNIRNTPWIIHKIQSDFHPSHKCRWTKIWLNLQHTKKMCRLYIYWKQSVIWAVTCWIAIGFSIFLGCFDKETFFLRAPRHLILCDLLNLECNVMNGMSKLYNDETIGIVTNQKSEKTNKQKN